MALKLYSLKILGMESEFSIWVSQALDIWNSGLPSACAIFWLSSATSRVVIPRRARKSFNCSLGGNGVTVCPYYLNHMGIILKYAQGQTGRYCGNLVQT